MSCVKAEPGVATFEETLHLCGAFDLCSVVRVEHYAEALSGPDLLYHRQRREELVPLAIFEVGRLLVVLLPRRRGDHEYTGASRSEVPGLPLYRGQLRIARLLAM